MPPKVRCLICNNAPLRAFVDAALNKGFTNAGIAASVEQMGGKLDPVVVGRHKHGHWVRPMDPDAPKMTKGDLAILVRDKVYEAVEGKDPDMLLLMGKELAPMIGKGLQAEAIIDKREATNKKLGLAAGALSLQAWIAGLGSAPTPPELEDGLTIEGTAVEVE